MLHRPRRSSVRWLVAGVVLLLCWLQSAAFALAAPAAAAVAAAPKKGPPPIYEETVPILILCAVIALMIRRLPKVDVGHTDAFRRRRVLNWLVLGLTYAFLYMGRYNLNTLKDAKVVTQADFGTIDFVGNLVYGVSFLVNGPLTDKLGGRATILLAAGGAALINGTIGVLYATGSLGGSPVTILCVLYGLNMYFQSFGAVSIVKVNASWFHVRERGTFGGIFGILISLGLYFAFDWIPRIRAASSTQWVFFAPAIVLAVFCALSAKFVRDTPGQAGLTDFDPMDASSGDTSAPVSPATVIKRMLTNKIILTIAVIELCSGFLRQGILKWYRDFASGIGQGTSYLTVHWGMVSCIAGITGGMFAGVISDHLFQSRRAPVSSVLYMIMLAGAAATLGVLATGSGLVLIPWVLAFMTMAIIGVHGMLSGVASQDFGGRKNAGVATGLIDGFVYLGGAMSGMVYGQTLPEKCPAPKPGIVAPPCAAHEPSNWYSYAGAMIPFAVIGLLLALRLWNARPAGSKSTTK